VVGSLAGTLSAADSGICIRCAAADVHTHIEKLVTRRQRRRFWKGLDFGTLYEGVLWVLFSNR